MTSVKRGRYVRLSVVINLAGTTRADRKKEMVLVTVDMTLVASGSRPETRAGGTATTKGRAGAPATPAGVRNNPDRSRNFTKQHNKLVAARNAETARGKKGQISRQIKRLEEAEAERITAAQRRSRLDTRNAARRLRKTPTVVEAPATPPRRTRRPA